VLARCDQRQGQVESGQGARRSGNPPLKAGQVTMLSPATPRAEVTRDPPSRSNRTNIGEYSGLREHCGVYSA
jgi:hypothetical protein